MKRSFAAASESTWPITRPPVGSLLRRPPRRLWGVLVLAILLGAVFVLSGCISILSAATPTNVEAGTHYTMKVRVQPDANQTGDGRMTLSFRIPNQWTVTSVTYAGAVSGSFSHSGTIANYFATDWEAKPVDATHNGSKAGYVWWSGYSGNLTGLLATQWADITIVVNTNGFSGAFSLDFVTGLATQATPTVKADNGNGAYWELGEVLLNRAVTLLPTVKPFVNSTTPAAGSVNVAPSVSPTVTFSENMDPLSLAGNIFVREDGGPAVASATSYNPAGKTFTVNPNADLNPSTAYLIVVSQSVRDEAGNSMAADYVVGFTTAAPAPVAPQVIDKTPASGATGVAVGTDVTADFDQDMDDTTINDGTYYLTKSGSATKVPAVITYVPASKRAVIDPSSDLDPSTEYTVTVAAGVKGANTLALQGAPVIWSFTTAAPAPVAPQVTQKLPAPGTTGVIVGSSVSAVFDQDMNAATLTDATFTLKKSGSATAVAASVSYVGSTRTAVLDPTSDLEPGTLYEVTLTGAVQGANALAVQAAPIVWSFTTAASAGSTFPDVPPTHQFYDAIQGMADLGIINGYTNHNFGPGDPVRRWQFAKMIVGALSLPIFESDTSPFTDLDPDDVTQIDMTEYVAVAFKNGITTGTTSSTYGPYTYISRTQVVTMVTRAVQGISPAALATPPAGYTNTWGTGYSSIHGPLARTAQYNGLLDGIDLSGAANDPWSPMPRGEVAQILWNMMDMLNLR